MRIICDIDDILNDLIPKTLTLYNAHTGKNVQLADITTYDFYDCLPDEDANGIIEVFKDKKLWDSLRPLAGAQKGLRTLINSGHEVYLATATLPETLPWKIEWLKKYFSFVERARAAGINIPIIPGIKPIHKRSQLNILPKTFRVDLPGELVAEINRCKDDADVALVGREWGIEQCRELMQNGVPSIHFYTLNAFDSVYDIAKAIY